MAVIGISLIVASVVIFCLRPPTWLPRFLANLRFGRITAPSAAPPKPAPAGSGPDEAEEESARHDGNARRQENEPPKQGVPTIQEPEAHHVAAEPGDAPMQPASTIIQEPQQDEDARQDEVHIDEQTTPKASAATRNDAVPSLVLSSADEPPPQQATMPSFTTTPSPSPPRTYIVPELPRSAADLMPPPPPRAPRDTSSTSSTSATTSPAAAASALMPPPPAPKTATTKIPRPSGIPQPKPSVASPSSSSPRRIPTLNGTALPAPARNLPIPRRGGAPPPPGSGSGGLAPPPTATSIPKKPSRQVTLEPGHSPLDWARLAQSPTSDLRGLPADAPYLRVTPSMLKQQNGRKGRDAWSAFGGKVYNISPYIPFHPGGGPELLRGAGKDGTRLFAEVHPWVNYETMLQSCLVGLLVDEHDSANQMEEMD